MEIYLTPEQESQLSQLAAQEGKGEVEVAREVLSRGLAVEARFISAVKVGREVVESGQFRHGMKCAAGPARQLR